MTITSKPFNFMGIGNLVSQKDTVNKPANIKIFHIKTALSGDLTFHCDTSAVKR